MIFAAGLLALVPTLAAADWIVTRDGERLETRGPWEVRGKLLVFTLPQGQLSSLRLSRVDLEASQAATRRARESRRASRSAQVPVPRTPVLVLSDGDLGRDTAPSPGPPAWPTGNSVNPAAEANLKKQPEQTEEQPAEPPSTQPANRLTVSNWDEILDGDGVVIVGRVQNVSPKVASNIELALTLLDDEGTVYDQSNAVLSLQTLGPGEETHFRAEFPQTLGFASVLFELDSMNLETVPGSAPTLDSSPTF